jgi:hypothetical protein
MFPGVHAVRWFRANYWLVPVIANDFTLLVDIAV